MQQLGGEKEESVEILDKKKAEVVLCSVPRFFRPETRIASSGGVFFQKPVTEYAGLSRDFSNRSFLFYFVSAYLCDQRDGEAEVQSIVQVL